MKVSHEKTTSAKMNSHIAHKNVGYYLVSTFISCQSRTQNVVRKE